MLPFQEFDVGISPFGEGGHRLKMCDITDRLEYMDRVLEKRKDIGRIYINPVLVLEILGNLAMIKAVLPEFKDLPGEFFLRAATQGGFPAGAAHEGVDEVEDLFVEGMIKPVEVEPG